MSDPILTALAIASGRYADTGDLDELRSRLEAVLGMVRGDSPDQLALPAPREPGAPAVKRVKSQAAPGELAAIAARVFEYWRAQTGHDRARLTPERVRVVIQRLKQGYSEAEIRLAIDGNVASEFHAGGNEGARKYDDLTLICRTGSKLEGFIEIAPGDVDDHTGPADSPEVTSLKQKLRAARDRGDKEAYEQLNRAVRKATS